MTSFVNSSNLRHWPLSPFIWVTVRGVLSASQLIAGTCTRTIGEEEGKVTEWIIARTRIK